MHVELFVIADNLSIAKGSLLSNYSFHLTINVVLILQQTLIDACSFLKEYLRLDQFVSNNKGEFDIGSEKIRTRNYLVVLHIMKQHVKLNTYERINNLLGCFNMAINYAMIRTLERRAKN